MSPVRLCMRNMVMMQTCQVAAMQLLALLQRVGGFTITQSRGTCLATRPNENKMLMEIMHPVCVHLTLLKEWESLNTVYESMCMYFCVTVCCSKPHQPRRTSFMWGRSTRDKSFKVATNSFPSVTCSLQRWWINRTTNSQRPKLKQKWCAEHDDTHTHTHTHTHMYRLIPSSWKLRSNQSCSTTLRGTYCSYSRLVLALLWAIGPGVVLYLVAVHICPSKPTSIRYFSVRFNELRATSPAYKLRNGKIASAVSTHADNVSYLYTTGKFEIQRCLLAATKLCQKARLPSSRTGNQTSDPPESDRFDVNAPKMNKHFDAK